MFAIQMAGLTVGIDEQLSYLREQCRAFYTDRKPDFTVRASAQEIAHERTLAKHGDGLLESICVHRHIAQCLPDYDAFVLHAAVVERGGRAFVFGAPSGTGKTTHSLLWLRAFPDAEILNGDKPIIRRLDGVFTACDTPWRGLERLGNGHERPIAGLCLLERGETNRICRANAGEQLLRLFRQLYVPPAPKQAVAFLELLHDFTQQVPLYTMTCNRELSAAQLAYDAMAGG